MAKNVNYLRQELGTGVKEVTVNGMHIPFGTGIVFHEDSPSVLAWKYAKICGASFLPFPTGSGSQSHSVSSAGTELTGSRMEGTGQTAERQMPLCLCPFLRRCG